MRVQDEIAAGKVVIVAGFQGATDESHRTGEVTTLGRGGSDTTAVALAARLGADRCEIYTDVEGIFTADPRVVPDARLLPVIGYEEMLELAHQGAQVMQTRAVELGWVNGVVICVRSTFSDHPGTLIKEVDPMELRDKVRGLALDRKVAKITLVGVPDRPGIARAVFDPLAESGINIDLIVQNVGHAGATDLSFTVPATELARARRLLDPVVRDLGFADMTTDAAVAKVSIVGVGHRQRAGLRGEDVRGARGCGREHRDDLHLGDPHHLHHRRGPGRARPPARSTGPSASSSPEDAVPAAGAAGVGPPARPRCARGPGA